MTLTEEQELQELEAWIAKKKRTRIAGWFFKLADSSLWLTQALAFVTGLVLEAVLFFKQLRYRKLHPKRRLETAAKSLPPSLGKAESV